MTTLALLVAVVAVAAAVAALLGRVDGGLGEPTTSASYVPLPEDRLTPADLESLRLDTAVRGYRMAQVDEVVGRLAEEIRTLNGMLEEREARSPACDVLADGPDRRPLPRGDGSSPSDPPLPPAASGAT